MRHYANVFGRATLLQKTLKPAAVQRASTEVVISTSRNYGGAATRCKRNRTGP